MSTLEIDAPATHNIFFTPYGDTYTPPFSGVISLPGACPGSMTTDPLVSVSLTRSVTLSTKRKAMPQFLRRKKQTPTTYTEVVAWAETQCSTQAATRAAGNPTMSFDFSIAVPTSLCSTTHGPIMTVSYALVVRARTEKKKHLEATHELQICRTMSASTSLVFEHFRKFQRAPFSTRLFLSPEHLPNLTPKGLFNGTILFEGPLIRRGRPSEIKVVAVREVRWSVAEAVEISHRHPSSPLGADADKMYMRTVCEGRIRGNWMPEDLASWKENTDALTQTQVPFQVLAQKATSDMELLFPLPKRSPVTSAIAKDTFDEHIGIFVSHRMRLEIVIGEDTFVQRTETLVDRKAARQCLGATYPLHIGHIAYDAPLPEGTLETDSELPGYEDSGRMPPAYSA